MAAQVTAGQVEAEIAAKNQKTVVRLGIDRTAQGKVYIYNVGPKAHTRGIGGIGSFYIPACKPGKDYSEPLTIDKIFADCLHIDTNKMAEIPIDGAEVAKNVVGFGQFQSKSGDLRKWGVFISLGDKPTKNELDFARAELNKTYDALIREADGYWQNPRLQESICEDHYLAAEARNAKVPWLRTKSAGLEQCLYCFTMIDHRSTICANCKSQNPLKKPGA